MKNFHLKKSIWQSLFSFLTLAVFAYFAIGSFAVPTQIKKDLGNGVYEVYEEIDKGNLRVTKGAMDDVGRWTGNVLIKKFDEKNQITYSERVFMVDGLRNGKSEVRYYDGGSLRPHNFCYKMGETVDCEKSGKISQVESSSFEFLNDKYPWYLYQFYDIEFDEDYVRNFLDTLEIVLYKYEAADTEANDDFDDYFSDAMGDLEETPYDSLIQTNNMYYTFYGMELLKNSEFRLATFDQLRSDESKTYDIVISSYSNYLFSLNETGVSNADFETFCTKYDSLMLSYGTYDLEDPFFVDTVDERMYRALIKIREGDEKSAIDYLALKSSYLSHGVGLGDMLQMFRVSQNKLLSDKSPEDVATGVLTEILSLFAKGDLIRKVVHEAYLLKNGMAILPTVTTSFFENYSSTSIILNGNIIEDGGAEVSEQGMAWGNSYNPTIENEKIVSELGLDVFSVTLDGLTEGETYYARTYAVNSVGISYGNCIKFVAQANVGIKTDNLNEGDLRIFPNPANEYITIAFSQEFDKENLCIYNVQGSIVAQKAISDFKYKSNTIKIDVSGLKNGSYYCRLYGRNGDIVSGKFQVMH